jgi:hypothetical protein
MFRFCNFENSRMGISRRYFERLARGEYKYIGLSEKYL